MRKWLPLLGILISVLVLVLIFSRVDLRDTVGNMRRLGWGNWLIGAGIYLSAFLPRGWRWKLMLPESDRLPWRWVTAVVVLGYAANDLLPFRLGELVRSYLAGERFKLPKLTCLGTIAVEKVLDGCCLLGLLAACLPLIQVRGEATAAFHRMCLLATSLFGLAIAGCFWLAFRERQALGFAQRFGPPLATRLVEAGLSATGFFRRPVFWGVAALTVLVWLLEAACFVFFAAKLGVPDPWPKGVFCLVVVNLSILVPSAPGYVGVFHAGAVAAFLAMGFDASLGLAIGTVTHGAQFLPTVLIGLVLAAAWGLNWRRLYHLKDE
jgi:uncharacterized membrane protein YbhN (UPF0104 family)